MRFIPKTLLTYLEDARAALRFAPVEIAMGIATAITFSVYTRRPEFEPWLHVGAAAALAFPLVLGLSILRLRGTISSIVRWGGTAAVLLAVAAWSAFFLDPDLGSEGWRFASLFGVSVLALTLVPVVGGGDFQRERMWHFIHLLVVRVGVVGLYTLVLYGALSGALAAVITLFDLETPEHLFQDVFGILFFGVLPWMIAGAVPALARSADTVGELPIYTRLAGRFVFVPVLLLYLTIVLAYVVKVVVTGEMPKNLLSPLVLAAGAFGFLLSPFLQPLVDGEEGSGVARLVRIFPLLLIPAIPPAVWAIWVRREQYGWTEFRYLRMALLIALGGLAVYGAVRLFRKRKPLMLEIPIVLGVVLLLSALGPWSAQSVSRRNQENRLRSALEEANLTDDRPRSLPEDLYEKIQGSAQYLYHEHGLPALRSAAAAIPDTYSSDREFIKALHVTAECSDDRLYVRAELPDEAAVTIPPGMLYRFDGSFPTEDENSVRPDTLLAAEDSAGAFVIRRSEDFGLRLQFGEAWSSTLDLTSIVDLSDAEDGCDPSANLRTLSGTNALYPIVDSEGIQRGSLIVTDVSGVRDSVDAAFRLRRIAGIAILRTD